MAKKNDEKLDLEAKRIVDREKSKPLRWHKRVVNNEA